LTIGRFWRPSQIQQVLGKADAIFSTYANRYRPRPRPSETLEQLDRLLISYRIPERFYLRSRVEAAEKSGSLWFDKDRYARSMRMWTSLDRALYSVLDVANALLWCRDDSEFADADRMSSAEISSRFEELQSTNKGLEPLYRLNNLLYCR
jgi:hypothetical protein